MATPHLTNDALKFIKGIQDKHAKQILLKILSLCHDPEPPDSIQLKGNNEGLRRADSGEYRIIYRLDGDLLEVRLVGKRNDDEVYRRLSRR